VDEPGRDRPAAAGRGTARWDSHGRPAAQRGKGARTSPLLPLTLRHLAARCLPKRELLFEALVRRGFLVALVDGELLVPRGPHNADLQLLSRFLGVERLDGRLWQARLEPGLADGVELAERVLSVPQHPAGRWMAVHRERGSAWSRYRRTRFGHVVAVGGDHRHGGLDLGVGLLVKALLSDDTQN
jgi:hypothetical protein